MTNAFHVAIVPLIVRWALMYVLTQNGQDVVRASCVGCGICVAVCPRGVLSLENASEDISQRGNIKRTIKLNLDDI
ncbi:hypothetical protein MASR1M65_08540 [Saprospiraceae bacterium]